jgi:MFS family permease
VRRRLLSGTKETFASFRIRNFRLFFVGQSISQIGNWLTLIAQTLLVLERTGSGFAVGLLTACQFLPVLVLGPWAGLKADRMDKRRLLFVVQCAAMAQSAALAAFAFVHGAPVGLLFGIALLGGVAVAFDNPARRSFVVEMVPEAQVQNAVSLNSALMTGSRVIGPALAGALITTVGYGWCFSVDAVSYVGVLVGLWMMRPEELRSAPVTPKARGQIRAGFRYMTGIPELWIPMAVMAVIGTLAFNFQVVMPLFVKRTFSGDDGSFTLLYSVISVGSLVGALATARRVKTGLGTVVVTAAAFGAALLALAASPSLAVSYPLGVLVGVTSISFMTSSTAIVQMRADPSMRGRVLALQAMVFLGSTPIGGPIVGAVCEAYGARAGLVIGGVGALVAAGGGWLAARRTSRRRGAATAIGLAEPDLQVA